MQLCWGEQTGNYFPISHQAIIIARWASAIPASARLCAFIMSAEGHRSSNLCILALIKRKRPFLCLQRENKAISLNCPTKSSQPVRWGKTILIAVFHIYRQGKKFFFFCQSVWLGQLLGKVKKKAIKLRKLCFYDAAPLLWYFVLKFQKSSSKDLFRVFILTKLLIKKHQLKMFHYCWKINRPKSLQTPKT